MSHQQKKNRCDPTFTTTKTLRPEHSECGEVVKFFKKNLILSLGGFSSSLFDDTRESTLGEQQGRRRVGARFCSLWPGWKSRPRRDGERGCRGKATLWHLITIYNFKDGNRNVSLFSPARYVVTYCTIWRGGVGSLLVGDLYWGTELGAFEHLRGGL